MMTMMTKKKTKKKKKKKKKEKRRRIRTVFATRFALTSQQVTGS